MMYATDAILANHLRGFWRLRDGLYNYSHNLHGTDITNDKQTEICHQKESRD